MAIFLTKDSRVLVQGMTGAEGSRLQPLRRPRPQGRPGEENRRAMSKPVGAAMRTTLTSDIPDWEGEFTFDQVRFVKPNSRDLVLELTDGEGNSVAITFPTAGVKKLLSWRLLMSL